MKLSRVIILFICCLLASQLFSQELNSKFELKTASYSYKDYNGHPQIRSITQDKHGLMYFANQFGIAVYNGDNWSFIDFLGSSVRSLACDSSGVVYVGGIDFGCLETQKNGFREFKSFKSLIPDTLNFGLIENISVIESGLVFFQSKKFLLIYNGATISIIEKEGEFNFNKTFVVNDEFYVEIPYYGIKKYENGKLVDYYINDLLKKFKVSGFFNFCEKQIIVTENDGVFLKESGKLNFIFKSDLTELTPSIKISDTYLSIGTAGDGVFLLNKDFEVEYNLNSKNGLLDGVINCQFLDHEGNLWMGTNNGIYKVLINSPVSIYSLTKNKATTVEAIKHFNGATYFATQNGVFYSDNNSFKNGLKEIKGIKKIDCYGFLDFNIDGDTLLLIATVDAVYSYSSNGFAKKIAKCSPWHMEQDFADSTRIIVCNYDGLSSIKWNGNRFIDEGFVKGFKKNIYCSKYDSLGSLFIGAIGEGLYKTEGSIFYDSTTAIENISKEIDVIEDGHAFVNVINNNIYVGTNHGLYKRTNSGFEKTNEFGSEKHLSYGIHRIKQTPDGKVWMVTYKPENYSEYEIGYSEKINGKYVWHSENFKNYTDELVHSICNLDANITWLGGIEHVFRFDNSNIVKNNKTFHTLFNSIKWGDSVLYHGATTNFNYVENNLEINKEPILLDYSNNRMEFIYSATSFLDEKRTLYSYMLEGSDNAWSDWSKETKAQYTNLPEGDYVFKVRSKNYLNNLGIDTSYSFIILSPWYKTVLAYFLYVIAAILLLVLGIRVGTNRIKRQKDQLEKVVKQRTHEVIEQKNEIEGQREELQELYNDVTDSIRYAKRLQDSILPSDNFIKELFPESFVYFKPKDIVSGDFYWAEKIGENHLIAAVDCTGHGVPGAFMSLVGANGLNASVREHQLNETNIILEDLNRFAFSSLNKADEGESVRDGMDMSLISFNPKTREMTFSGANNPLYIVSNGEFKIIKGDKLAIGSFKPGKEEYTQHSVELKTNDMVYLFSDGYPDQFGGEKGKKLMYKQFRNILVEISTLSIEKQMLELDHRLQQWKLNQEQVDDILVIGFRVN